MSAFGGEAPKICKDLHNKGLWWALRDYICTEEVILRLPSVTKLGEKSTVSGFY